MNLKIYLLIKMSKTFFGNIQMTVCLFTKILASFVEKMVCTLIMLFHKINQM